MLILALRWQKPELQNIGQINKIGVDLNILNDMDFKSIIPKALSIMKSNNNKFSFAGIVSLILGPSFDIFEKYL